MDLELTGKKVLVTGASKGIGRGIAEAFAAEGAIVGAAARSTDILTEMAAKQETIIPLAGDLTDEKQRETVFQTFLDEAGDIDILVNNLGGSNGTSVLETDMEDFYHAMEWNYFSAVHLSKLAYEQMIKKQEGVILQITSIFGRESGGKPTYNNAKAALISFTKSLADEAVKKGIRVNSIAPGSILHPSGNWQKRIDADPEKMKAFVKQEIPAGRFGTVEEIANTVLFLASPKSSWIIGASINVDGGQSNMNM